MGPPANAGAITPEGYIVPVPSVAVEEAGMSILFSESLPDGPFGKKKEQAPIEIPSSATVKVQAKNGYDQISFKWTENGQNYEVRWHTKTPGAPEGQGINGKMLLMRIGMEQRLKSNYNC